VLGILLDLRGTHDLQRSAVFAELTLDRFRSDGVVASRSVKQANFVVLRTLSMPSILVEAGFLSHTGEARLLAEPEGQRRIGRSLARSVLEYFEGSAEHDGIAPLPALRVHTVERGDTLWRLAAQGGWSAERLQWANALPDASLRVGQRLLIP
jgi:N-acetylmuramoyl-L-alanine amidase